MANYLSLETLASFCDLITPLSSPVQVVVMEPTAPGPFRIIRKFLLNNSGSMELNNFAFFDSVLQREKISSAFALILVIKLFSKLFLLEGINFLVHQF